MKKGITFIITLAIGISIWWQIFIPAHKTKRERIKPQALTQNTEDKNINQTEIFDKKYQVLYGLDENISLYGFPRYTRKILVNLGLSRKELTDNLVHAAWELQKEKSATAVMIFAYRRDDPQRNLYSAGRCTLAPFGDWAKATDKKYNSVSNLSPIIDIAEIYFKDIPPMYKIKSNVVINTHNTKLYKNNDLDSDNVIAYLRKGLEAIIVGSQRTFSTDDFLDIYKIRFTVKGNKTAAGWVFGNDLDESQNKTSNIQATPQKQVPQTVKGKYQDIRLYGKTIAEWKKAKREDKLTICEAFILVAIAEKSLKIKITDMDDVSNYAKVLANSVDKVSNNTREFNHIDVIDMLAITIKGLGWL